MNEDMLKHLAEPASPKDQADAVGKQFAPYEALYFAVQLREYAAYEAETEEQAAIATAYAQDIRERLANRLPETDGIGIYAHTSIGAQVLQNALYDAWETDPLHPDLGRQIEDKVMAMWGRHHADDINEHAEEDGDEFRVDPAPDEYEVTEDGIEIVEDEE